MNTMSKWKSLFGFKFIRFKFSSQSLPSPPVNAPESKPKDMMLIRTLKLAQLLDCTTFTAREIISRNDALLSISSFEFIQNATFCSQFLKLSDVVELPCLLTLNPSLLENRYFSLQELGCSNISGISILRYQQLLKKTSKALAKEGLHFSTEKHLETCRQLIPEEDREAFWERLQHMQGSAPLWQLRECVNAEAFAAKLGCSIATTHHMFRIFPPLRTQSTRTTLRVFDVLRDKFRFSASKICHSTKVLSMHPEALVEFLEQLPTFLEVDTTELARRLPLLLRRPTQRLMQVESVLREAGVQPAQLLCCPKAALLCPRTLRARLEALDGASELRALRPHRRFLWLAYCFGRLERRLRALGPSDNISIAAFTASEEKFRSSLLRTGGGHEERRCSGEALAYLAQAAGVADAAALLPPSARPRLPNCVRVVEFLRGEGVSRAQLAHGLEAALYDAAVVRAHWEGLRARPQWAEWAAHYNLLQLLVYAIEVESGFRGRAAPPRQQRNAPAENQNSAFGKGQDFNW